MDPKEIIRRKNNLFRSIMNDPRLSRSYRDALLAPPGSTKREQAKSTFSIMKKVGGLDGKGGPLSFTNTTGGYTGAPTTPASQTSFGNMMIFPAAPKLKKPLLTSPAGSSTPLYAPTKTVVGSAPSALSFLGGNQANNIAGVGEATKNLFSVPQTQVKPFIVSPAGTSQGTLSVTGSTTEKPAPKRIRNYNYGIQKPMPLDWQQSSGLIPRFLDWYGNTAMPAMGSVARGTGKALLSLGGAIPALGQFAVQNAAAIPGGLYRGLWSGADSSTALVPWVSPSNTWAGKKIAELWPSLTGGGVPTTTGETSGVTQTPAGAQAPAGEQAPVGETQQGKAPAFYSNLGKQKVSATGANVPVATETGVTDKFKQGIIATEGTGDYTQVGKITSSGYPALGKYQIMPNIWFGSLDTPLDPNSEEDVNKFLNTPELQDELFGKILESFSAKYNGDQVKMAAAYFGGDAAAQVVGTPEGDVLSDGNMTVNQYVASVLGASAVESTEAGGEAEKPKAGAYVPTAPEVSAAIAARIGAAQFGLDTAKAQLGGTPIDLHVKAEETLRKNYGMDKLEEEVSRALIDGPNFRPTLQKYINGRDQVLKEIDKRIAEEEARMVNLDMGDPNVAQRYKNHMAYLYTLKGAQEQRYGNYLDNAVAQFESDYMRKKTALETAQTKIDKALSIGDAMSVQQYEEAAQAAAAAYTELQNAPLVDLNYQMALQQYQNNMITQLKNMRDLAGVIEDTDPDYNKNYDAIVKRLTGGRGADSTLLDSALGPDGIYGFLLGSPEAQTAAGLKTSIDALGTVLGSSVMPDPKTGEQKSIERVIDIKNFVADFKAQDTGEAGQKLMETFVQSAKVPLKSFVEDNLPDIQAIIEEMVKGKTTINKLAEEYPGIPENVIEDLFSSVGMFVSQGGDVNELISSPETIVDLLTARWVASG